jgi:hypothetical protein
LRRYLLGNLNALPSIRYFPEFPNPFSTPMRMQESHGANAETCRARACAFGLERGGPALHTSALRVYRSRLILWERPEEILCICKKLVDPFRKSMRASVLKKLRNHPEPSQRK